MTTLYRIADKVSGELIGDFIISGNTAELLSSTHKLISTEELSSDLTSLKSLYSDEVNAKAAQVRGRFITLIPGQETTYARKAQEAVSYLQAINPVDSDYPYLDNEATATGKNVADLASEVLGRVQSTDSINVIIEAQRKRGVKQIAEAVDNAAAIAARDFAIASLDSHQVV